ncbi:MAG: hypothetical protein P9X24_12680 [Candidatus Hatepunaea meridiana]|nr:hypothetical protein [Candidatus Hatepunaea meridiana]
MSFLTYLAGILLIMFLFIKPGSLILIQKELKRREIRLSWNTPETLILFKIIHLWFLPVHTAKSKGRIQSVCFLIREIQTNTAIREEAHQLEGILKQYNNPGKITFWLYKELQTKLKIATGKTKKRKARSGERQIALMELIDGLEKLSEIQADEDVSKSIPEVITDTEHIPSTHKIETERVGRRESLLELVKKRLPEGFELKQISLWQAGELEKFALALLILPEIHPMAVVKFLSSNNINGLLSKRSNFMEALNNRDKNWIIESLKLPVPSKEQEIKMSIDEYSNLLNNINVVIIGGGKLQSKRNQLCIALGKLGAKPNPVVFDPFEDFKGLRDNIKTAADNTLYLLYTRAANHCTTGLLEKKKREYIAFKSISTKEFLYEVTSWYVTITS